jgi:polyferredoxin
MEFLVKAYEIKATTFERAGFAEPTALKPGVKTVPTELRRRRGPSKKDVPYWNRVLWRLKHDSQYLRSAVQTAFLLLCMWIGIEFYLFVQWGMTGIGASAVNRPPGVEGFLPISSFISLRYWLQSGIINNIHPSGLFVFIAILLIGLLMKKAFCSWMCPIGTLSESLWMLGERLFGRNIRLPRWVDYPLRSLKYLILAFFAFVIGSMELGDLRAFIESPYNKMADVNMYLFFANISSTALWPILVLVLLSVVVKNFWCRYLCPYGGLLGLLSVLSPLKITRQSSTCIDCELCTKSCPAGLKVHVAKRVWSDECTACYKCVEACPVKNTLDVRVAQSSRPLPSWIFGTLVTGVFIAIVGLAMITGKWQNSISGDEYKSRFQELDTPAYEHFGARGH